MENKLKIVKRIKKITNFNPFEMMNLNKKFIQEKSKTVDDNLIEKYEKWRFHSINISHKKFVEEVLKNDNESIQWFLKVYAFMNIGVRIPKKDMFIFVDLNIMEIRDNCIYSIAPIYVKALKRIYSFEKIRNLNPNRNSAYNFALDNYQLYTNVLNKNGKGIPFQRCVEFLLTEPCESATNFFNKNYICYTYDAYDEQFLKFQVDSLMIITNPSFHFMDFVLFKIETSNNPPSNNTSLTKINFLN